MGVTGIDRSNQINYLIQAEIDGISLISYQQISAEEKSSFTFEDAMSFVGEGELAVAA